MMPSLEDREAWLEWRKSGIGASDTPVIMGLSEYKTPFELFEEKTGRKEFKEATSFVIEKGHRLEPIARQKFAAQYNLMHQADEEFQPKLVEMEKFKHVRASLDGISFNGEVIIEIKYQGKDAHQNLRQGIIKPAYHAQINHQLLVSQARKAYLVSINDSEEISSLPIEGDPVFMGDILQHANVFMSWVRKNRWPTESKDEHLLHEFKLWGILGQRIKHLQAMRDSVQTRIFETGVDVCGDFRVKTTTRKGAIQYGQIPELKGVDLEKYRAEPSEYKRITTC